MDRKIAIQIQRAGHCHETIRLAAQCGFKYVSIGFGDQCDLFADDGWEDDIHRLKAVLDENGLKCIMTHLPYYNLLISAEISDERMDLAMRRCVTATAMLGAEITALHPRAYFYDKGKEDTRKSFLYNIRSLIPLMEEAERVGCMIGIENLPIFPGLDATFYSNFPAEHKRLVDAFQSPNVCAVWDFGHGHLAAENHAEAIALLGGHIRGTHVHDNSKDNDNHLTPFDGNMDWKNTKFLKTQLLEMMLKGVEINNLTSYLSAVDMKLPGPYFFVVSIFFSQNAELSEGFFRSLLKQINRITDEDAYIEAEKEWYVYAISNQQTRVITAICSVETENAGSELVDIISEISASYGYQPIVAVGDIYHDRTRIVNSYIESMNKLHNKEGFIGFADRKNSYDVEMLKKIRKSIEYGDNGTSIRILKNQIEQMQANEISVITIQCLAFDFYVEIKKIFDKYNLRLSERNISLLATAKTKEDFEIAATQIIDECADRLAKCSTDIRTDGQEICAYIQKNFVDCDISLESVADYFKVDADVVRQSIKVRTGQKFREYVVSLRIECAKELLLAEESTLAELSLRIGYRNVSYFIAQFKEHVGITPTNYRKKYRKAIEVEE